MMNIFRNFFRTSAKNTLDGRQTDLAQNGCENTTNNTETSSNYEAIYTKTKTMTETSLKTFQWIKGEKAGSFVKWGGDIKDEDGINYLLFEDGTRANEELLNDYIMEIPNENEPFYMTDSMEEKYEKDRQAMSNLDTTPRPYPAQQDSFAVPGNLQVVQQPDSPIAKLLKDSKKTKSSIGITIVVDIPPVDLMKVLSDSYDDGEKQVLDYLSASLNVEDIKRQIAHQIWVNSFKKKKTTRNETV